MNFTMNSIIRSNRVGTGFVVISTGELDASVFATDSNGKVVDWQPLDSHHFSDGDDDLAVHINLMAKWQG